MKNSMPRAERTPPLPPRVSALAAIASLYCQWRVAGRELERLARDLTCHDPVDGFRALDRVSTALLVTDELIAIAARAITGGSGPAEELGAELFEVLGPWLAAVRRELPDAATLLYTYVTAPPRWREITLSS